VADLPTIIINQGGVVETTTASNGNDLGNIILNGGTLSVGGNGYSASYYSLGLLDNVYVTGTAASKINFAAGFVGNSNAGIGLGFDSTGSNSGTTPVFSIAPGASLVVSATLATSENGGTGGSLILAGGGNMTLTAANVYKGATTIAGGTLQVGNGTSGSLYATSPYSALIFNGSGGTINFDEAASSSQNMGALTASAGDGTVESTFVGTSAAVTFSSLATRTAGATLNFVTNGGTNGLNNNINLTGAAAGFISQGDFYGGSTYAWMNGAGTYVRAINYSTDTGAATSASTASLTATNYQQITGAITAQNTATFLTIEDAGSNNFTLASGQTLTVNGILESGGSSTFSGGSGIDAASGAELVLRTNLATDNLTVSTPILANGSNALTKSGLGTVTLSANNTYSGITTVDAGTLALSGSANTVAGQIYVNGGTLAITGGSTTETNATFGDVYIANAADSTGSLAVSSGASFTANATGSVVVVGHGAGGVGIVNNAGTMSISDTYGCVRSALPATIPLAPFTTPGLLLKPAASTASCSGTPAGDTVMSTIPERLAKVTLLASATALAPPVAPAAWWMWRAAR
jgi:autotransporter-associated beta strand protein